jgi:hypothetical protein
MRQSLKTFVQKHAPALCDAMKALRCHSLDVKVATLYNSLGLDKTAAWRLSYASVS